MRLGTLWDGSADGKLVAVSADGTRWLAAGEGLPNLLQAIEQWSWAEKQLQICAQRLAAGEGELLDPATLRAPMPRSWQWLDGSAFTTHAELMQVAFGLDPIDADRPLMYQGISDRFYGPGEDVLFASADAGIDFEGEFGIVVDAVPMGTTAEAALSHIKLLVQINDWSLRAIAPIEMKTGFGWVQAKPPCSMAPFAVTPDELGGAWKNGRIGLDLVVDWNGRRIGSPNGREMAFSFPELVAHAARTRDLVAGTIIGSGTVSNANYAEVGSTCISEIRALEIIADGRPTTRFMTSGDSIRMEGRTPEGYAPFGAIEQSIVVR